MGDPAADDLTSAAHPGRRVYAALSLQVLISAGTYLVAKRALSEFHPIALLACRFILSGLLFCVILAVIPGRALPPRPSWPIILMLGLLAGPLNQGLFLWGLSRSTAAHAALLYALTPLGVYLHSLARGRETSSFRRLAGIAVAFSGVVVLLLGRGLSAATGPLVGDLFILGGVVAWALYTAEGKPFIDAYGPIRATAWSLIAAAALILPVAPFFVRPDTVAAVSAMAWAGVVYLAVLTSVVSYMLWYFALSRMEASKVAVFSNLQPVVTALLAWWMLGEKLNWEIAVGGILVLAGVRLTQRSGVAAARTVRPQP